VYGLGSEGEFTYAPKKKVVANSVVGAGDCFVAILALAYSHQMPIGDCIEVAFEAASVYVQKRYNEPITPYELLSHEDSISAKFIKPEDLIGRNFSLCFTNGCFDVLHQGHIELLRFAKSTADKLVVEINTDESVVRLKGQDRPINSLESRMYMLSMFEFVDFIIPFDSDTPLDLIEMIHPEVLCKGGDYKPEDVVGADVVKDVRIFPYVEGKSTSNLIKKIRGDI
jgi:D-beta-D-heptose 7-phosphate kinase/D-beta-D-heptose 1-phosphate adenosyltransferase